jgi:hypothetical protein
MGEVGKRLFYRRKRKASPHLNCNELIFSSKWDVIEFRPPASFPGNFIHCYFYSKNSLAFSRSH